MFGKLIFLCVSALVVYAPPVPLTFDSDEDSQVRPYLSKTPTNLHEACIMIGELRQDLNQQSKALKNVYIAVAPAALSDYVSQFLQRSSGKSLEEMTNAINRTNERVVADISELLDRADLDSKPKLKTALADTAGTYFVHCRYNLAFSDDEDVKKLGAKLTHAGDIDEDIFCREMTFLYVKTWKTWSFARSLTSRPLDLDTILEGLRAYKLAEDTRTVKAVRVVYDSQMKSRRDSIDF